MIKKLLANKKAKKEINEKNKKLYPINTLCVGYISYYETNMAGDKDEAIISYTLSKYTAIFSYKQKIHIKSGKKIKDVLHIKKEKNYLYALSPLFSDDDARMFMYRHNLTENDNLSFDDIVTLEEKLNCKRNEVKAYKRKCND